MPLDIHDSSTWVYAQLPTKSNGNIPYWVLADLDAYHEEFVDNGNLTRVLIATPWVTRHVFRLHALGYPDPVGSNVSYFVRWTPLPNPYQANQYLVSLKKHAIHVGSSQTPPYRPLPFVPDTDVDQNKWFTFPAESNGFPPRIIYDAVFSCPNYDIVDQTTFDNNHLKELSRFVTRSKEVRARERRTPSFGYETDDASATPIPEVGFLPFIDYELTYTWRRVPIRWVPETAIANCSLKINDNAFDYKVNIFANGGWLYGRYRTGDILFKGLIGKVEPYRDPHGQWLVDLPYLFSWQPADGTGNGQLKVPCTTTTSTTRWVKIRERGSVGSPKYLYASANLDTLFQPEPP